MKKPVIDLEIEDDGCDEDWLLNENLLPGPGSSGSFSLIYKRQAARKAFKLDKQENRRSNNCRAQVSALDQLESEPSTSVHKSSTKHRRSEQECTEHTALAESSRKRRLVKKNAHRDVIGSALSTADTQCSTGGFLNTETLSQSPSNNFIDQLENEPRISRKPESASAESAGHEDFLEIGNLIDISLHSDEARGAVSREVQEIGSDTDDVQGERETRNELESSTSAQLSCVICWTEFSLTRGILPCGHRFCFSCIQSWADRMVESKKSTTCPLCKATFSSITKVDGGACFDQKIYSQTIPSVSSTQDIVILPETGQQAHDIQVSVESACCGCGRREPVDLLIYCNVCQIRCVHSSCLDPPLFPWVCNSCKDLRFFSRYFL